MNEKTAAPGRDRRSIFNIRFMKGARLRLLFGLMTAGMMLSAVMIANVIYLVNRSVAHIQTPDLAMQSLLEEIRSVTTGALLVGMILTLGSAVTALLFGFLVSHRFYGPIVPLSRQLREFSEGRYAARVKLRPGDELGELAEAQNALGEELERRNTPPHG